MKSKLFLIVAVVLAIMLSFTVSMVGCKLTTTEKTAAETMEAATTAAETTEAATTAAAEVTGTFDIAAFEGGYGVEWMKEAIKVFSAKYPKVTVNFTYDPKIADKVQPLFVAGTPPDVFNIGSFFDVWGAIKENQIMPLQKYLNDSNAIDKEVPWINTFAKGTFASAATGEDIWYMPLVQNSVAWWYNKTVWDKHGWTPPKTWDEAYALFDIMKKAGIAPIANQGIYPMYIRDGYICEFMAKLAGPAKLEAAFNLAPNSWTDPEVVKVFAFIKDLADKYFQAGNLGMNHLQSQAEVMVGNAGLISCGSWFPKEEEQVWTEGDVIMATEYPPFTDSPYPQNAYELDSDLSSAWVIPAKAQNPELAVDFLKILYSEQIQKFIVTNTGNPTAYDGSSQWIPDNKFGNAVKSSLAHYEGAAYTFSPVATFEIWYPAVMKVMDDNIVKMLSGKATPEEVCSAIQKAADDYKADSKNFVHSFSLGLK